MKFIKNLISTSLLLLIVGVVSGQPLIQQYLDKANEEFEKQNYSAVLEYVHHVSQFQSIDEDLAYMAAESARMQNAYASAGQYYAYLIDTLKSTAHKDAYLNMGMVKHTSGQYKDAKRYYEMYLSESEGDDAHLTAKADMLISSTEWALDQIEMIDQIQALERLDNGVNTPYSEHAAFDNGEQFYFTSFKFPKENDDYKPARLVSKVLSGSDENLYQTLEPNQGFNNGQFITSGAAISSSNDLMFFSLCDYDEINNIKCALYYQIKTNNEWSSPIKLPEQINEAGSSSTQPSIGATLDGKTRLYFVSDRSSGIGKRDIYSAQFDEEMNFSTVIFVDEINTAFDDVTPYFDQKSNELFFSSNGREGFGNYDVYKKSVSGKVVNLGPSVNTSYNEIYYSISTDLKSQYVSSNRPGSMYLESKFETCCYDIYRGPLDVFEVDLLALTFDAITKKDLTGVKLTLTNKSSGKVEDITINDLGNEFNYKLYSEHEYEIEATKDAYYSTSIQILRSDIHPNTNEQVVKKLYLKPEIAPLDLVVNTYERPTNFDLNNATIILYDSNSGEELARISDNPANQCTFEVLQGGAYRLVATREGYEQEIGMVNIPKDQEGSYRKDMYLGRIAVIETLSDLIPLKLYFDNDQPHPRSKVVSSTERYRYTYSKYVLQKSKYIDRYSNLYGGVKRQEAAKEVEQFFDVESKQGYDNLSIFLETLNRILLTGKKVHLYLRGYASPLSMDDYNDALGKRRVDCVRNEFRDFENGILLKYINSKQLIITERSFGEAAAPSSVSDDPSSPTRSIFSPSASRERRVEIDEILEVQN